MKLTLDKSAVEALLTPEHRVVLEGIVYEKVAQEVVRKLEIKRDDIISGIVKGLKYKIDQEMAAFVAGQKYGGMRPEVNKMIEEQVQKEFKKREVDFTATQKRIVADTEVQITKATDSARQLLQNEVKRMVEAEASIMTHQIKELARSEFMNVMREVKRDAAAF